MPLSLGRYPTPVQRVDGLSANGSELWIKRDDLTHEVYGGNKVRKLELLLGDLRDRGVRRVVTMGAAGSHFVVATCLFAEPLGFEVEAVLVPQPATVHVREQLRAGLGLGLRPYPVGSWAAAPAAVASRLARGASLLMVGGSSVLGATAYVAAAREVATQVELGQLPEPDVCVVALGSGGTAGGLSAGFALAGMKTRVVGVCVSGPPWLTRRAALRLERACLRREGHATSAGSRTRLAVDARFLGAGYGHATSAGDEATAVARLHTGLTLDPTYTAKAFAGALSQLGALPGARVLYWHTLSSAPMEPLLLGAPGDDALDVRLRALLLPV